MTIKMGNIIKSALQLKEHNDTNAIKLPYYYLVYYRANKQQPYKLASVHSSYYEKYIPADLSVKKLTERVLRYYHQLPLMILTTRNSSRVYTLNNWLLPKSERLYYKHSYNTRKCSQREIMFNKDMEDSHILLPLHGIALWYSQHNEYPYAWHLDSYAITEASHCIIEKTFYADEKRIREIHTLFYNAYIKAHRKCKIYCLPYNRDEDEAKKIDLLSV